MKIYLILTESSLELVPKELQKHPSVVNDAKRRGKNPSDILLNISRHFHAMKKLRDISKRGRPDIVHLSLITALDSPINKEGKLEVYIHTINDLVIRINSETRLPRFYDRFEGLMVQVLKYRRAPLEGEPLLEVLEDNLEKFIRKISPDIVIGLSRLGRIVNLDNYLRKIITEKSKPMFLIGGFQKGHFSEKVVKLLDDLICISKYPLSSHLVICKVLSKIEEICGVF